MSCCIGVSEWGGMDVMVKLVGVCVCVWVGVHMVKDTCMQFTT